MICIMVCNLPGADIDGTLFFENLSIIVLLFFCSDYRKKAYSLCVHQQFLRATDHC